MATGRWGDDAYPDGLSPVPLPPAPKLERWMKWTWPAMFVAAAALTAVIGKWGWVVALVGWFATCAVPYWLDVRASGARHGRHARSGRRPATEDHVD